MLTDRETLVTTPPSAKLQACIIVPVRNEEDLLPSALRALAEQKTVSGGILFHELYEVILLINNTTDRSRQAAESFLRLYPTFRLHIVERSFSKSRAHVGHARRLLMDEACRRLKTVGDSRAAILSTDADSQVAPNWIACNQEELAAGADAVGGRIVIPACEKDLLDPAARELHRYDQMYRRLVCWIEDRLDPQPHDPWPRHHQHFGVSLAVKPQVYKAAGRLPPRRCFEDLAFYDALIRYDVRVRHSNKVKVFTSARLVGRTRAGLSTQLSYWAKRGKSALRIPVESGAFLEQMFAARHDLRLLWLSYQTTRELPAGHVQEVSAKTGIKASQIAVEVRTARTFGLLIERLRFYEMFRKTWPDWVRLAPLRCAIEELLESFKAGQRYRSGIRARRYDTDSYDSLIPDATLSGPENGRAPRLLEGPASTPAVCTYSNERIPRQAAFHSVSAKGHSRSVHVASG